MPVYAVVYLNVNWEMLIGWSWKFCLKQEKGMVFLSTEMAPRFEGFIYFYGSFVLLGLK